MLNITIDVDGLEELQAAWEGAFAELAAATATATQRACQEGAEEARAVHQYKDRTGALTASITGHLVRVNPLDAEGVIEAKSTYASFVEEGTSPHEITGSPLVFEAGGATVFTRRVQHPGTSPRPFMGPALQKAERVLQREGEVAVERAAERMSR